jgi:Domain of unknown function (DUF4783)
MKNISRIMVIGIALFLVSFRPMYSIEEVVSALRTGNVPQLARYFDDRIDLSLPGKSDNYSRTQAEMILKDFFSSNPVKDFQVKHKGENNGSEFCFGVLQTKSGNFRVKLYMKQKGERQVLQEMGILKVE